MSYIPGEKKVLSSYFMGPQISPVFYLIFTPSFFKLSSSLLSPSWYIIEFWNVCTWSFHVFFLVFSIFFSPLPILGLWNWPIADFILFSRYSGSWRLACRGLQHPHLQPLFNKRANIIWVSKIRILFKDLMILKYISVIQ